MDQDVDMNMIEYLQPLYISMNKCRSSSHYLHVRNNTYRLVYCFFVRLISMEEGPIPRPEPQLTEIEPRLREFVDQRLLKHVKRFATVFGVVNVVALIGIWFSVQNAARDAAITAAKEAATTEVHSRIETLAQLAQTSIQDLIKKSIELEGKRTELATAMNSEQTDIEKLKNLIGEGSNNLQELQNAISTEKAQSSDLAKTLKDVQKMDTSKLAELIDGIGSDKMTIVELVTNALHRVDDVSSTIANLNTSVANLNSTVGSFEPRFQRLTSDLSQKLSLNGQYHLRSTGQVTPPVYLITDFDHPLPVVSAESLDKQTVHKALTWIIEP
jgi:hypothetical protein